MKNAILFTTVEHRERFLATILNVHTQDPVFRQLERALALPPARQTEYLANVKRFFEEERNANDI